MAELTYIALDLITDAFIEMGACRPASNQRPTRRNGGCAS
jgi:hypothetical protein